MIICLLALDGMLTTSLSLPLEMLNAANQMYRATHHQSHHQSHRENKSDRLSIQVVGVKKQPGRLVDSVNDGPQPVTATGGMQILPHTTYHDIQQASVIFIPSFWRNPRPEPEQWSELCQWLTGQHSQGARICATGTGVFLLAATGLLNGLPATTHWFYLDRLQAMHPEILLKKHHLLTRAGRLDCAGSVNSIADLTVHIIAEIFDTTIATRVSQQFSPEIRRHHSDLFDVLESHSPHRDETIVLIQQWFHENYAEPVSMSVLAKQFSMSQRTLNRRFIDATGVTPCQWLQRLRVARAQELLTSSNLEIGEIALRCGFHDTSYFSRTFRKHMATTPLLYRTSVRSKLFTP